MFSVALGLKISDFGFVRSHPRSILIGTLAQLLALPLMTLGLILILEPTPGIALGMIIVACCPGGNVSNLLTRIAHGDTAYSVSLTLVSTAFVGLFLPAAILFWSGLYGPTATLLDQIDINRVDFIITTTISLLGPLLLGLATVYRWPLIAERLNKILMPVAIAIVVILVTVGIFTNIDLIKKYLTTLYPLIIGFNAAAFLLGYIIGKLFLSADKVRSLTFEVGIQNTGLGLIIVLAQFGGVGSAALVVGSWSIWHMIAGLILANLYRLFDRFHAQQSPGE